MMSHCAVALCAGPADEGKSRFCARHIRDPLAPPMKITCECVEPDVEPLTAFGPQAAQCRQCGSPIRGPLTADISPQT